MERNTFFGANNKLVISQNAISKSIWGNFSNLLKKRGICRLCCREYEEALPNLGDGACCRGSEIWGFIAVGTATEQRLTDLSSDSPRLILK